MSLINALKLASKGKKKKRKIGEVDESFTHSGGKGEKERIKETTYEGIDTLGPKDDVSIFDLEGRGFVTLPYDRTRAGFSLTKVDDVDLKQPVDYHGGQDYMYDTPGLIGASGKGVMTRVLQQAKDVEKYTGKKPLFMPNRLQGSGSNFSRQPVETMIQYAASNLGKDGRKELNAIIKTIVPDFKGIGSKDAMTAIRATNDKQKVALQNALHNAFGGNGGITTGQARALASDPAQLTATKTGFQNVAEIDTSRGLTPFSGHHDYPYAAHGEPVGQLKEKNLMYYDLMTDKAANKGVTDPRNLLEPQRRSAQMGFAESGVITEDKLKKIAELVASGSILTAGTSYADQPEMAKALNNKYGTKEAMRIMNMVRKAEDQVKQERAEDAVKDIQVRNQYLQEAKKSGLSDKLTTSKMIEEFKKTASEIPKTARAAAQQIQDPKAWRDAISAVGSGLEMGPANLQYTAQMLSQPMGLPMLLAEQMTGTEARDRYVADKIKMPEKESQMSDEARSLWQMLGGMTAPF